MSENNKNSHLDTTALKAMLFDLIQQRELITQSMNRQIQEINQEIETCLAELNKVQEMAKEAKAQTESKK